MEHPKIPYKQVVVEQAMLIEDIQDQAARLMAKENPVPRILKGRLKILNDTWEKCRSNHAYLISCNDEDDATYNPKKFLNAKAAYNEAVDFILEHLPDDENQVNAEVNAEDNAEVNSEHRYASSNEIRLHQSNNIKLPRISIPTFSGIFSEWLNFRDLFSALVIENANLSSVEKMHFLKTSLTGEALILVQNQPITSQNFENVWETLKKRYNNNRAMVNEYLSLLHELPDLSANNLKQIKHMRDIAVTVTSALQSLGIAVTQWDYWLVFLLSSKLDKSSRFEWENLINFGDHLPTFDSFLSFLDMRIRSLDAISSQFNRIELKVATTSKNNKTTVHSHQNMAKFKCPVCDKDHKIYNCQKFKAFDVKEREAFIKKNSRCFNCFGMHNQRECKSKYSCFNCGKKHNSLLHRNETQNSSRYDEKGDNNKIRLSEQVSFENYSKTESLPSVSTHFNTALSTRKPVLLATAKVVLIAPNGRQVYVRALLDQGSEASFLTETIVKVLRLNRDRSNAAISGIGGYSTGNISHSVSFKVATLKNHANSLTARAFVLPKITAYVPSRYSIDEIPSELRDLEFADPYPQNDERIDFLIGADLYGDILRDGVLKGPKGTLTAQLTIFGWILSGKLGNKDIPTRTIKVHHAFNISLNDYLRRFWEIEEIPSISVLSKDEIECEKHFI